MNEQDEINSLKKRLKELERRQKNCLHKFGEPFYNAEEYQKEYLTGEYEVHGVDRWAKSAFAPATRDRWTRKCNVCGMEQHTYQQEVIKIERKPKF